MPQTTLHHPDQAAFEEAYQQLTGHRVLPGRAEKLFRLMATRWEGSTAFGTCEVAWEDQLRVVIITA